MAINIEVDFACHDYIDLETVIACINSVGVECSLKSMECINNWQWVNERKLKNVDEIYEQLTKNHIVISEFCTESQRNMGMIMDLRNDKFMYDVFADISSCACLDKGNVHYGKRHIIDLCYKLLFEINKLTRISLGAIGVEPLFSYCGTAIDTVKKSHGIAAWILPKTEKVDHIDGYIRKEKGDYYFFENLKQLVI